MPIRPKSLTLAFTEGVPFVRASLESPLDPTDAAAIMQTLAAYEQARSVKIAWRYEGAEMDFFLRPGTPIPGAIQRFRSVLLAVFGAEVMNGDAKGDGRVPLLTATGDPKIIPLPEGVSAG